GIGSAAPVCGGICARSHAPPGSPPCDGYGFLRSWRVDLRSGTLGARDRVVRAPSPAFSLLSLPHGSRGGLSILAVRDFVVSGLSSPSSQAEPGGALAR